MADPVTASGYRPGMAPAPTEAPTPVRPPEVDTSWIEELATAEPGLHAVCCAHDEFLCGAPYHPEAATSPTEDVCPDCQLALHQGRCRSMFGGPHFHCPVPYRKSNLWSQCSGPKENP